jgi:hypothetical protein
LPRQAFELVGADSENEAGVRELLERALNARKGTRAIGNVGRVMRDEVDKHLVELCGRDLAALGREPSRDHRACTTADRDPALFIRHGRHALATEDDV